MHFLEKQYLFLLKFHLAHPLFQTFFKQHRINLKQSIGGQWNYFSSQIIGGDYANSLQRIPNYNTLDLRYSYNYAKNIDYSLSIKNLMNTNYYSYAVTSDATTVSYYPDPRRSFMASARFMFD